MKVARTVLRGGKLERAYLSQLGQQVKYVGKKVFEFLSESDYVIF